MRDAARVNVQAAREGFQLCQRQWQRDDDAVLTALRDLVTRSEMRAELAQIIGRAVVDGKNPRAVRTEIAERLEVSRGRALGYAQTDITDTLRQARMAEADHAREEFGLGIGLLWTSALLPTTRPTHAARHRKVYTSAQVKAFYAVNGNRYRCHCSITECLLDEDGMRLLGEMADEHDCQVWVEAVDSSGRVGIVKGTGSW